MASWTDVRRLALALPESAERTSAGGNRQRVGRDKMFAWERPLRRRDLGSGG